MRLRPASERLRAVREWEMRPEVLKRERELQAGYRDWIATLKVEKALSEATPPAIAGAPVPLL